MNGFFTYKLPNNVFFKTRNEKNGDFFCGEGIILDVLFTAW